MSSLSQRLLARTGDRSHSHPANSTGRIDVSTINGRIQYAFGTILTSKLPEPLKDSKLAKGMRMLWPHMSKDIAKAPEKDVVRAVMFVDLMMQMCLAGAPEGMTFEDYLEGVMTGTINIMPGRAQIIEHTDSTATA